MPKKPAWTIPLSHIAASVAVVAIVAAGCKPASIAVEANQPGPAPVPVDVLARQWGLHLARSGGHSAWMIGGDNSLLIIAPPSPEAILNGRRIAGAGDIAVSDGRLTVSRALARRLRAGMLGRSPRRDRPDSSPPARPAAWPRVTVVLDPGHGGRDAGAPNRYGPAEKIIALDTALQVRSILAQKRIQVILTRQDNSTTLQLAQRADIANRADADLFVSIHADAASNRRATGFTVYVARKAGAAAVRLARHLIREIGSDGKASRGLRRADYRVLVKTAMPAALVELGYLSNRGEARRLSTAAYRRNLARAIAAGIVAYIDGGQ